MAGCKCEESITTYGEARFNGRRKHKLDHMQDIAYMPQHENLETISEMTGRDFIALSIKKSITEENRNGETDEEISNDIIKVCGLGRFVDRPLRKLSGGQRQRIRIAEVLVRRMPYTFLDESTTGLDANTAPAIIDSIKRYAKKHNLGVVVSIHQLSNSIVCAKHLTMFLL
ncbi:hypothetical protein HK407_12g17950 [Ordospora pajunii]|uniref:uncharacterized protein n=1 Tax=Ordospora pajunii TaxID=3039483 RepID=UPI0029526312|nr:uncharacterized protein HK407_12g17950 [Ordospora pajunii]KAH9410663.1 hypothetical protein HK407_12g17950 [Ordospora pajunii]